MPEEGNLELKSTGIWEVYNGRDWVNLNEYWGDTDPETLRDFQDSLGLMKPIRVTGTTPSNYQFILPPDPRESGAGPTTVDYNGLGYAADLRREAGDTSTTYLKGDLTKYYEPLGFKASDFKAFGRFNPQAYSSFLQGLSSFLDLSSEGMTADLPDGGKVTIIGGKGYRSEPTATGIWSVIPIQNADGSPSGYVGVTTPDGDYQVKQAGSSSERSYSLLAQQTGGVTPGSALTIEDYARGGAPQDGRGLAPGAVIEDIVPGYDAIQTSEGKYQIVSAAEGADMDIGGTIDLPDGRQSVKIGPDKWEVVTPSGVNPTMLFDAWGQPYLRQADGSVSAAPIPTVDDQINMALIQGDPDKAVALSDFRDRPDAQERFQAAMDYARAPGDLMAISAIVRGLVQVPPPQPGQIQRVAAPPPWVVDAWNALQGAWGISEELRGSVPGVSGVGDSEAMRNSLAAGDNTVLTASQGATQATTDRISAQQSPQPTDLGGILDAGMTLGGQQATEDFNALMGGDAGAAGAADTTGGAFAAAVPTGAAAVTSATAPPTFGQDSTAPVVPPQPIKVANQSALYTAHAKEGGSFDITTLKQVVGDYYVTQAEKDTYEQILAEDGIQEATVWVNGLPNKISAEDYAALEQKALSGHVSVNELNAAYANTTNTIKTGADLDGKKREAWESAAIKAYNELVKRDPEFVSELNDYRAQLVADGLELGSNEFKAAYSTWIEGQLSDRNLLPAGGTADERAGMSVEQITSSGVEALAAWTTQNLAQLGVDYKNILIHEYGFDPFSILLEGDTYEKLLANFERLKLEGPPEEEGPLEERVEEEVGDEAEYIPPMWDVAAPGAGETRQAEAPAEGTLEFTLEQSAAERERRKDWERAQAFGASMPQPEDPQVAAARAAASTFGIGGDIREADAAAYTPSGWDAAAPAYTPSGWDVADPVYTPSGWDVADPYDDFMGQPSRIETERLAREAERKARIASEVDPARVDEFRRNLGPDVPFDPDSPFLRAFERPRGPQPFTLDVDSQRISREEAMRLAQAGYVFPGRTGDLPLYDEQAMDAAFERLYGAYQGSTEAESPIVQPTAAPEPLPTPSRVPPPQEFQYSMDVSDVQPLAQEVSDSSVSYPSAQEYFADPEAFGGPAPTPDPVVWEADKPIRFMEYGGTTFRDTLALVGEEGPELVNLPAGSEVVPADFTEAMMEGRRPRRMANGGYVSGASFQNVGPSTGTLYGQEYPRDYPAGVKQVLAGRPIEQPRSLFRPAGLTVPSAQAQRSLIPEEMEAYRELGRLTGIPEKAFEREFRSAVPGGVSRVEQPRFMPRRMRRV